MAAGDVGVGSASEDYGCDDAGFRHSPMVAQRFLCLERWVSGVLIENGKEKF